MGIAETSSVTLPSAGYPLSILIEIVLFGAVIGAQFGSRAGALLRGEQLRGLLALFVLAVCIKIGYDLVVRPEDLLSVELLR